MLLIIHLIGAVATGIIFLLSLRSLIQKHTETYQRHGIRLAVCSGFQLLSGALLTGFSVQTESGAVLCTRLGVYLSAIIAMEYLLYRSSSEVQRQKFPLRGVFAVLTTGTIASLASFIFF